MLHKIYDPLLALIYPQICQICENSVETSHDGVVCRDCWQKTRIFSGRETICHKCGRFLNLAETDFQTFCHQCSEHFYDSARAAGLYENGLQASVLHLKREPFIARRLKRIFISAFLNSDFQDSINLIIPVPLSKKRFLERGFNQAALLAAYLSGETNIEMDECSLARRVHTPMHRAGMDTKARELTVKNAFEVKRPKLIKGNVLLVDDVFTSGATVSACAKVLKKNGAEKVYVFTVARAF